MDPRTELLIDGSWRPGVTGATFPVCDPATGDAVTEFAIADPEDCTAAVEAAERARPGWATVAPRERGELLRRTWQILRDEREQLAETIVAENGKAFADALGEVDYGIEFFRWFAEEAVRVGGEFRLSPAGDKHIVVDHRPVGVSLLVTPWNFPVAMATRKLAPALAAGCTTVLKPAEETPLSAALVLDALQRAGLPDGVVNLVTPRPVGPAVSAMLHHPAVRKLSFTGSTEVGRLLLREAADTVVSTSMELGGNAAFLVLPGADVEAAVEGALVAKMRNGGSACTAANRFYVHHSLSDAFTRQLADRLAALRTGPGHDRANQVGALVSTAERDKVAGLVTVALDEGATLVTGGVSAQQGAFYSPTLLSGVRHGDTIAGTEIFGPVATVIDYDDVDTAVAMADDTVHGLIAYVYGPPAPALAVARRLDSGMVAVNRAVISDPAAPFGGTKQSGLGREGGFQGIEEYLEPHYIGIEL